MFAAVVRPEGFAANGPSYVHMYLYADSTHEQQQEEEEQVGE